MTLAYFCAYENTLEAYIQGRIQEFALRGRGPSPHFPISPLPSSSFPFPSPHPFAFLLEVGPLNQLGAWGAL